MGRSFFSLPVLPRHGPSLHLLKADPGVLAVQGYVDDTTIAGDGLVIRLSRPLDL